MEGLAALLAVSLVSSSFYFPSISSSESSDLFIKNIQKKKRAHKTSDPDINGKKFLVFNNNNTIISFTLLAQVHCLAMMQVVLNHSHHQLLVGSLQNLRRRYYSFVLLLC